MQGDPDRLHSYSYTPDVARGLAILGTSDESWGKIWHLPVAFQGTTRELATYFAKAAGQELNVRLVPRWMMHVIGLFAPPVRASIEMLYQFEEDYVVDDSRFRAAFGDQTTPIEDAVNSTLQAF